MARIDIRKLVRSALERVKASEEVQDNDPSIALLKHQVVRTIAELEVTRAEKIGLSLVPTPAAPQVAEGEPADHSKNADPNISAVA